MNASRSRLWLALPYMNNPCVYTTVRHIPFHQLAISLQQCLLNLFIVLLLRNLHCPFFQLS